MGRCGAALVAISMSIAGPVQADDASRLRLAKQIVEISHADDNMRSLLPTFMAQMRELIAHSSADPKDADVYAQRFEKRLREGIPNFIELVAHVYAREFSEDDLGSLLAFYQSAAGQHFLAKQLLISRSMVMVGQDWGKSIGQEVIAEMAKDKAAKTSPKL